MGMDEYTTMAVVAVCGIVGGLILSKILFGNDKSKNSPQKINQNEIKRWKINDGWSDILLRKNPMEAAKAEYSKLMRIMAENESDSEKVDVETEKYLQELEEIRDKINKETTPLNQLYMRDINLSRAMGKMATLRQKSEDINAINVSYAHHERFLNFVSKGYKKPDLAGLMDNTSLQIEIDNPYNKNVDLIISQIEGMTKDGDAPMSVLKEILNLNK